MKKIEYPNRGHLISDYLVDGVARAYQIGGMVSVVMESPTGIETPNANLKNESVRLLIPLESLKTLSDNFKDIQEAFALQKLKQPELEKKGISASEVKEVLSNAFFIGN
jgi:hypothetical protein